jgi:hypothetical protein
VLKGRIFNLRADSQERVARAHSLQNKLLTMEIFGDHPVTSSPTSGCTLTASEKRVAPDRPLFTTHPRKNSASTISRCCALKNCCGQDGQKKVN